MAKKQGRQNQKRMVVIMRHVTTPDAEGRLSRAIDILLRVAAKGTAKSEDSINAKKEKPPHQAPAEDALTAGDGEQKNGNEGKLPHD